MNLEKQLSALTGTLLGLLLAAGSIGCLQSAFHLTLRNPAALWGAVFLFGALYAQALQWKRGSLVFSCLTALALGYLWRKGTALEQTEQLLQQISAVYDRAYHWGVLSFGEMSPGAVDLPLGIWATIILLTTVRTVCLQKRCSLPVLTALIPFAACIVVTDTVPGEPYLFLLLAGLLLLILPASLRRENLPQSIRLTAGAVLPVALFLTGLFLAIPQESYVNQTAIIQENLRTAVNHLPQLMEDGLADTAASFRGNPARTVDLSRLGDRIPFTYPVMEVTAQTGGRLYLRGQDYDRYDGLGWTATENRQETFPAPNGTSGTITIRTRRPLQQQYLPYYPGEETPLSGGLKENPEKATEYSLSWVTLPDTWRKTAYLSGDGTSDSMAAWLELPEATRQGCAEYLAHLYNPDISNTAKADIIAALVTDTASYSLTPEKMPAGKPDFVLWFLEEAESGYCIHFATAATVLLRAADVPARYVTGYMTEAMPGETVTVTEEDAHAWAEYYEPNLDCWIPLEATPADQATTPETQVTISTVAATEPEITEAPLPTISPGIPEQPEVPAVPAEAKGNPLLLLLLIPVLGGVLAVQRSLRLKLRQKRQRRGNTNDQALQRFREAERLARLLKETPAEELIDLAQKAKYSQHELTREELQHFDSYCRSCLRRLKEKPLYLQLFYKYFYAVY